MNTGKNMESEVRIIFEERLSRCRFPRLNEKYEEALRDAVIFILKNYDPVGIIVSGTIIRGNPDPSSDFDIYSIHMKPYRQRVQKFFRGIPAEIFVNPPSAIEGYYKEEASSMRPCTAHMMATGFVVLDRDPVIEELRSKARESLLLKPEISEFSLTTVKYTAATYLEDAMDVAGKDPATTLMFLYNAVTEMLHYTFKKTGKYIPRTKDILNEMEELDAETARLVREFFTTPDYREKIALSNQIADRTIEVRGFFEWESDPEITNVG